MKFFSFLACLFLLLAPLSQAQDLPKLPGVSEIRLKEIYQKTTAWDGPNCWASSLYLLGLREHWTYVSPPEFDEVLSTSCQSISSPQPGDLVDIRKVFDGKLEHHHAFLWVNAELALSKKSPFAAESLSLLPLTQMQEFNDPAVSIFYYHCSAAKSFRANFPQEANDELASLEQLLSEQMQKTEKLSPVLEDSLLNRIDSLYRFTASYPRFMALIESAAYQFTAIQYRMRNGE